MSSIDWAEAPVEWLARGRETSSDVVAKVATRVSLLERRFGEAFQERTRRWNGMAGRCRVRSVVVRRCSVAMWCVTNECMRSTAKEWITDSGLAALKGRQSRRQTDAGGEDGDRRGLEGEAVECMDGDSIGVGSRAQLASGGPRCGGGGWIDCCSSKTSAPSVSHCLESVLHFAAVMNHSSFSANIPGIISLQHVLLEHPKLQEHSQTSRTRDFYLL